VRDERVVETPVVRLAHLDGVFLSQARTASLDSFVLDQLSWISCLMAWSRTSESFSNCAGGMNYHAAQGS